MKVTIIGGHGKIALLAASILAGRGDEVTSVIRNPEHVHDVAATGATALVLDVEEAATTEMADALPAPMPSSGRLAQAAGTPKGPTRWTGMRRCVP